MFMGLVHQRLCREVLNRQRTADGPHMLGRFYQRLFYLVCSVKFQRRTVRQDIADSPRLDRKVGSARLDLYWMSLSLPPPNRKQTSKRSLSFSLKHVGKTIRSSPFGVVPGRSEHIPGLFSRLCIMSSRYFNESLTLVLGISLLEKS